MRIYFSFVECPLGTFGVKCSAECPDGHYGKLCKEECDCAPDYYCDPRFGCLECPWGSFGLNCSGTCPKKYYGRFCLEECNCTSSQYCDPQRGCLKCDCTSNQYCDPTYGCLPKNKGRYNTCTPIWENEEALVYVYTWKKKKWNYHLKKHLINFSETGSMLNNMFQFVLFIAKHQSIYMVNVCILDNKIVKLSDWIVLWKKYKFHCNYNFSRVFREMCRILMRRSYCSWYVIRSTIKPIVDHLINFVCISQCNFLNIIQFSRRFQQKLN